MRFTIRCMNYEVYRIGIGGKYTLEDSHPHHIIRHFASAVKVEVGKGCGEILKYLIVVFFKDYVLYTLEITLRVKFWRNDLYCEPILLLTTIFCGIFKTQSECTGLVEKINMTG